jgi:hypothetical protein
VSITVSYRRLSPDEFERLRADPDAAADYFGDGLEDADEQQIDEWLGRRDASGRYLDIHKSWHGLHFLLTGDSDMDGTSVAPPLGNVVMGGTDTQWEACYGMVRYLAVQQVQEVARALGQISEEELRRRYDPVAFRSNEIYPGGETWDDEDEREALLAVFDQVRVFFAEAATAGEMVLLSSD